MNKSQLVDALADRLGDRRAAASAVDALLQIVVDTVRSGDSVSLAGFGVFESRPRAARTGRNPRTGEPVAVPATTVPAFRPGTGFRSAVAGDEPGHPAADTDADTADEAPATPAPRRRPRAATNGSGDAAVLDGAVDLAVPPTAKTVATTLAAVDTDGTGKGDARAKAARAEGKAAGGKAAGGKATEGKDIKARAAEVKAATGKAAKGKATGKGKAAKGKAADTDTDTKATGKGKGGAKAASKKGRKGKK